MPVSVIERIAQAILIKLQELVTSGDVVSVERPTRLGVPSSPKNLALFLYQDDPVQDDTAPLGFIQWEMPFIVDCYVVPSDTSTTPVDTAINQIRSLVEKKLREDPIWSLPGAAIDTRIVDPQMFSEINGSFSGVGVIAIVQYRTREDDPFEYT